MPINGINDFIVHIACIKMLTNLVGNSNSLISQDSMSQRRYSKLDEHIRKKGLLVPPLMALPGGITLSSWSHERLPEYLWLCFILDYYGREEGLKKISFCFDALYKYKEEIIAPKLSILLQLNNKKQEEIFKDFSIIIPKKILSSITAILDPVDNKIFFDYFYIKEIAIEKRLEELQRVVGSFFGHQNNNTTDIRFAVSSYMINSGRIKFTANVTTTIEAFNNYQFTNHNEEKMKEYRAAIRATEMFDIDKNVIFIEDFWRKLRKITECDLYLIDYKVKEEMLKEEYKKIIKEISEICVLNDCKNKDKKEVLTGLLMYVWKIFTEIVDHDLCCTIMGREGLRTIIECYIMIKYLLLKEDTKNNIWSEYKIYGNGKYKLIFDKLREDTEIKKEFNNLHIDGSLLETLVNNENFEEYLNIDLRYFDNENIKNKADAVGEKKLYDIFYEYSSNFVHCFWGAIKESCMLFCDNPLHEYHFALDLENKTKLSSIESDLIYLMHKTIEIIKRSLV